MPRGIRYFSSFFLPKSTTRFILIARATVSAIMIENAPENTSNSRRITNDDEINYGGQRLIECIVQPITQYFISQFTEEKDQTFYSTRNFPVFHFDIAIEFFFARLIRAPTMARIYDGFVAR